MKKLVFLPFSVAGGLIAGFVGKKLFALVWRLVDEEEAPSPKQRDAEWSKLVPALLIEGAIFRSVRGVADRGMRRGFSRLTGSWPGEQPEDGDGEGDRGRRANSGARDESDADGAVARDKPGGRAQVAA